MICRLIIVFWNKKAKCIARLIALLKKWSSIFRLQCLRFLLLLCRKNMQKVSLLLLVLVMNCSAFGQKVGSYAFARTPQLVNYNFKSSEASYSQGVSMGLGLTHQSVFMEAGAFILNGDDHGYYTFFGTAMSSVQLVEPFRLNTNLFGEITTLPGQSEQSADTWIFTSGICLFPNIQVQRLNIGIPLCLGLAYQDRDIYLNHRFILNLAFSLKE